MNDNKNFYKAVAAIALPIAFQNIVSSSLTMLDNLMVSSLSEAALASVGLATQLFHVHWMVLFGFCTGCGTFFTQFWGTRDSRSIRKVLGIAVGTSLAVSLVFFLVGMCIPVRILSLFTNDISAAEYGAEYLRVASVNFLIIAVSQPLACALRATQQTRIPMYASVASFICDVVFNYLFIFGKFGFPRLELAGAALATVISRVLELVILLIAVFVKKNVIAGKLKEYFSFDWHFAKRVYSNAVATTVNETSWIVAVAVQNACYGHLGITAFAAWQACVTIMDIFEMACFSLGDATLILVGECIGRGDGEEAVELSKKLIRFSLGIVLTVAAIIIVIRNPIAGLFTLSAEGLFLATRLIMVRAIVLPFNLYNGIQITGCLRAGGDAGMAAVIESGTMWLFAVPMAALGVFVWNLPIYIVACFSLCEGIIKCILLTIRYRSRKWVKCMITDM